MNQTAVPLGSTVTIANGLRPNLGYLLDCNQATYNIASGTEWHLLYIKAQSKPSPSDGWIFSLQSEKVSDVAKLYKLPSDGGSGQIPKLADVELQQVMPYVVKPPYESPAYFPTFDQKITPDASTLESNAYVFVSDRPEWPTLDIFQKIKLEYANDMFQLTTMTETGVHIYQIAYHRIVPGTPPTAEIVQVARSDFHFWPIPTLPIWSKYDNLRALMLYGCGY